MTPVEIALGIVSVLMLISRFLQAAKPAWDRLPKAIAVLLPPIVALIPQIVDLVNQTKTWSDLVNYLIAASAMVLVGLFPKSADESKGSTPPTTYESSRYDHGRHDHTRPSPIDPTDKP
jgi:hypothetical protein